MPPENRTPSAIARCASELTLEGAAEEPTQRKLSPLCTPEDPVGAAVFGRLPVARAAAPIQPFRDHAGAHCPNDAVTCDVVKFLIDECLTTRLVRIANDHGHESRATRLSAAPYSHLAISRADVDRIQLIPLSVG